MRKPLVIGSKTNPSLGEYVDSIKKSILKTVSWRVVALIITVVIALVLTGSIQLALSVGVCDLLVKSIGYFIHERVWNKIDD